MLRFSYISRLCCSSSIQGQYSVQSYFDRFLTQPKDLKLCLHRDEDYGPPSKSLTVTFNLMKADRDKEDELYGILRVTAYRKS
jgi:hypothetical protein